MSQRKFTLTVVVDEKDADKVYHSLVDLQLALVSSVDVVTTNWKEEIQ